MNDKKHGKANNLISMSLFSPFSFYKDSFFIKEKFCGIYEQMRISVMASSPITSWEIDGERVETVSDFVFWGSKITADGDCSHEIKRRLLLGRKVIASGESDLTHFPGSPTK